MLHEPDTINRVYCRYYTGILNIIPDILTLETHFVRSYLICGARRLIVMWCRVICGAMWSVWCRSLVLCAADRVVIVLESTNT